MRLYILIELKYKIFKLAYNKIKYLEYTRIYKKLTYSVYIFNIFIKLYKYLRHYLYYQLYQTLRYKSYKSLQSIYTPSHLFYIIIINFILTLSNILSYNYIILIINKFNKAINFIIKSIK